LSIYVVLKCELCVYRNLSEAIVDVLVKAIVSKRKA